MATLTEPVYTPTKAQGRIIEFRGYNARGDIEDGEMRDMMNLTADEFPAIYQRPARNTWRGDPNLLNKYTDPRTLLVKSHFRADGSEVVQQTPKLAVISEYSPKRLVKQITHSDDPDGQSEVIMCIFTHTIRTVSLRSSFYKFNTSHAIAENIDELIQSYDDFETLFYDLPEYTDEWIAASISRYHISWRDVNDVNNSCRIQMNDTLEYINLREGSVIRTVEGYAFSYDGVIYLEGLSAETKMVAINTKICFFPEKKYFKLVCDDNESRIGDIDAELNITDPGTCHIGPNTDLNFYSSTLSLPDDYNIGDYGFEVGDAVDINVNSEPILLIRTTKLMRVAGNDSHLHVYGLLCFERINRTNGTDWKMIWDTYTWVTNSYNPVSRLWVWKTPHSVIWDQGGPIPVDDPTWKALWESSTAYSELMDAFGNLETYEGYVELREQAQSNGEKWMRIENVGRSVGTSRIKSISNVKVDGENKYVRVSYIAKDIYMEDDPTYPYELQNIDFDVGDIVNQSEEGQYAANGVAAVSGIVQSIDGNSITLGDNSFNDLTGQQFDDVDIPFQSISITRKSPDLDYVMEHNNRLWGVSNKDNTIYASKLGDPTNWSYFQNTALDSYYAEQGSDGEWTGCAPYSSHLLFFKEDCIHKVYGSFPSEYQIQTSICHGVEKGSSKSIVFMNDAVLYKSRVGIMGYAGGSPQLISPQFGNEKYKNVVAGTDGRRYYASMEKKSGDHVLMVYDTEYQEWHKQDNLEVRSFAYINGKVVYAEKDNPYIMEMASDVPEADPIQWMAVLGPFDEYIENKKVYSRLKMRYKMPTGSSFSVYIAVDDEYDDDQWTLVEAVTETNELTQELFFMPSRCDQFAIKIVGSGYCKIKSMVREYRTSTMKKENY